MSGRDGGVNDDSDRVGGDAAVGLEVETARAEEADPENPDINDLLAKLETLEETVDDVEERRKVQQTIALVERMPGSRAFTRRVKKYTTRDMAESFVGGVLLSLPLLVEDGVFEIAEWFASVRVGPVPVFLVANALFVVTVTAGLLYYSDFRNVEIHRPLFGVVPRRLLGVLVISFAVAFGTMLMWGRLAEDDPTALEALGRVSVIWAAAAFGAALGDILPGESRGEDVRELFD